MTPAEDLITFAPSPAAVTDKRCSVVANSSLGFLPDGTIDPASEAVQSGMLRLRIDGGVDQRSTAVRQGLYREKPTQDPDNSLRRGWHVEEKERAFDRATVIPGRDADLYRLDPAGNVIYKHSYGQRTEMGWDIDHSKPLSKGGTYHPNNLQAMQSTQNRDEKRARHPYRAADAEPCGATLVELAHRQSEVDRRSSATRSADVLLTCQGRVDQRSAAVRQGTVRLKTDGTIDRRCSAVRSNDLRLKSSPSPPAASYGRSMSRACSSSRSSPSSSSTIHVGARGGRYTVTSSGKRSYVKK